MKINNNIGKVLLQDVSQGVCFYFPKGDQNDLFMPLYWDCEETELHPVEYTDIYWPVVSLRDGGISWTSCKEEVVAVDAEVNVGA